MRADRSATHVREPVAGSAHSAAPARRLGVSIFIENDIIYRHFVQSRAFAELIRSADVTFVFTERGAGNKRLTVEPDAGVVGAPMVDLPLEPQRIRLWRELVHVTRLVWAPGAESRNMRAAARYLVGPRAATIYTVLALPGIYQLFRWWTRRRIGALPSSLLDYAARAKPDVMIHPTVFDGHFINDFVLAGRRFGIPTIAIMNSWDNPSTKRAAIDNPDWVLVWGPQTRSHAVKYMGMQPARALPFGAAQFDIYSRPPRLTREAFCRLHDIEPAKRLLLYAGSSKGSDEFQHLLMLDEAIERGDLPSTAVVYRPHPWGDGGYKGERLLDQRWHHVVIESSMREYLEGVRGGKRIIHLADYAITHDVLSSIDALVSPLSTIILEAAMHDKPVLCLLAEQKEGSSLDLQKRLPHFADMYASPGIMMAEGEAELVVKVGELMRLVSDQGHVRKLRDACAHFVTPFDRPFSSRIVGFVCEAVATRTAQCMTSGSGTTRTNHAV